MSIYHKHHIIPKHMGGTDDPSNIAIVTIEQHAQLHKQLWEDLGHWQDELAWRGLSGQATRPETLSKIQKKRVADGTHHLLSGNIQRQAALRRIEAKTHNDEELRTKSKCPHCGKIGQRFVMRRWHFDKCSVILRHT